MIVSILSEFVQILNSRFWNHLLRSIMCIFSLFSSCLLLQRYITRGMAFSNNCLHTILFLVDIMSWPNEYQSISDCWYCPWCLWSTFQCLKCGWAVWFIWFQESTQLQTHRPSYYLCHCLHSYLPVYLLCFFLGACIFQQNWPEHDSKLMLLSVLSMIVKQTFWLGTGIVSDSGIWDDTVSNSYSNILY